MPHEVTASLLIAPAAQPMSPLLPTHLLLLVENFRPVWQVRSLQDADRPLSHRVATLDAPLADGLLAWLAEAAPVALATSPTLDRYGPHDDRPLRELATTQERGMDPTAVYRACAGMVTVLASIWPGSLLRGDEVQRAATFGVDLRPALGAATTGTLQ